MELDPMEAKSLKSIFATLVPYIIREFLHWAMHWTSIAPFSLRCFSEGFYRSVHRAGDDSNEFFKPDYMEVVGRYLLLSQLGDTMRLRNFIGLRQQATREAYKVRGLKNCMVVHFICSYPFSWKEPFLLGEVTKVQSKDESNRRSVNNGKQGTWKFSKCFRNGKLTYHMTLVVFWRNSRNVALHQATSQKLEN